MTKRLSPTRRALLVALLRKAAVGLALVGCYDTYGPPPGTAPMIPPPSYAAWWAEVEACSGKTRRMSEIRFLKAPGGDFDYRGQYVYGLYVGPRHIILADLIHDLAPFVRHEMLHAIENSASHTTHAGACKELVTP